MHLGIAGRGPTGPLIGVGAIALLLELRNICKIIWELFGGCHSWIDFFLRLMQLDDVGFLGLSTAVAIVVTMAYALIVTARNRSGGGSA